MSNESQTHKKQTPLTPNQTSTAATISSSFGLSAEPGMMLQASGIPSFQGGTGRFSLPFVSPTGQVFWTVPFPSAYPLSGSQSTTFSTINPSPLILPYGQFLSPLSLSNSQSPSVSSIQQSVAAKHHSSLSSQESFDSKEVESPSPISPLNQPRHSFPEPLNEKYKCLTTELPSSLHSKVHSVIMTASSSDLKQRNDHQKTIVKPLDDLPPKVSSISPSPFISKLLVRRNQEAVVSDTKDNASLKKLLVAQPEEMQDPLLDQLQDESDLMRFYKCFKASKQSSHLHIELLPTEGNGNLKWLQVRQKLFYIDPDLGPVTIARLLLSSNGVLRFQLLFPVYKAVYIKLFFESEVEKVLSDLSSNHVLCPGLIGYEDKYSVLGYHPSHVRVLETRHVKRYDHESCPIWHVPFTTYSKGNQNVQKMCKMCRALQNSIVRLVNKACEIDPAERESWTDPSSNRPLAYMSAADRDERYRKLRQERTQLLIKLRTYEERLGIGRSWSVCFFESLSMFHWLILCVHCGISSYVVSIYIVRYHLDGI